jgi:sarcosine oxidase
LAEVYDVIVVGVGGMGAAACWHLAERGQRVLGLDRHDIGHVHGSSHGLTRIIRLAYHEGAEYVPLVRRAMTLWRETGERFGESLMFTTGSLEIGPGDGAFLAGSLAAATEHALPYAMLTPSEINERFPGLSVPTGHSGLLQPDGGFIASERAIVAHVALAKAAGATIHTRRPVLEWTPITGGGVRIITADGAYEAGRLIISAGAWLGELVPDLRPLAVPERQVAGWFQPATPERYLPATFPVTLLDVEEGPYYMLPTWGGPGVKIGRHHHRGERGHPDTLRAAPGPEDEALLRLCLARYAPDANGPALTLTTCLYTNTPDEHFIIDTLPRNADVIVASPCSGHGYKFASVVGEILADMATGRAPAFDLSMFRLDRFAAA